LGKIQLERKKKFLDQKLQFTYPYAFLKDVEATGEAFRALKREHRVFVFLDGHHVDAHPDLGPNLYQMLMPIRFLLVN
jgi:hypothetical protein